MKDKKEKFTIGFIFDFLYVEYINKIFIPVIHHSKRLGHNIICFGVGSLDNIDSKKNIILDLISKKSVDGIISVTASIGTYLTEEKIYNELKRFSDIPIIHIGQKIKNTSCILIDNKTGMNQLMDHLILEHNYKKIAFLKGPILNFDAEDRFLAYKNSLKKHNLKLNEELIVQGQFDSTDGKKAIKILLDNRKVKFDALVCANDFMAIPVIKELQSRGYKIPEDIAVTGFDDSRDSFTNNPKLTTIRQPYNDIGKLSVDLIINKINNLVIPETVKLPTELIIRNSCGCNELDKIKKIILYNFKNNSTNKNLDNPILITEKTISEINKLLPDITQVINISNFYNYFFNNLEYIFNNFDDEFLLVVKQLINNLFESYIEIENIYTIINIIFNNISFIFKKNNKIDQFILLYKKVTILIGIVNNSNPLLKIAISDENFLNNFRINEIFINTFNLDQLKEVFITELPKIGINKSYICLFANKNNLKQAKIFTYINPEENKKLSNNFFPIKEIIPGGFNKSISFQYIILALIFKEEQLGYIVLEINKLNGTIYENLATQISSALKGAFLTSELNNYTHQLEEKVIERTKKLEEANSKLRNIDKLKNDFIANITHNFRSPLMVIMSITELAVKKIEDDTDSNVENYNLIYEASLKLKKSIDKLLELAKIDAQGLKLNIKRINIVKYFNQIINFYQSALDKTNIILKHNLPDNEINDFYIDVEKFEEIINNILSNAIKFINPENGLIKIKLKNRLSNIVIVISDNGIGIPKDKLTTIFNRFEQIKTKINTKIKGTGIGLAFTKQLVELMGGKIWAESKGNGKGASFFIELKKGSSHFSENDFAEEKILNFTNKELSFLLNSEIETILEKDEIIVNFIELNKEDEFDYKKGKILIIDDDRYIRKIIADYLISFGYQNYCIASDSKTALEAIYSYHPDLIICEYDMEPLKGDNIHDEIITNPAFKNVPFIFLSAIENQDLILNRKTQGTGTFLLQKPIDEKDLKFTIDSQLKQYMEYLKIYKLAYTDELSGLLNRRSIMDELNRNLSKREFADLSIIFFDIDNFKDINDSYGHQAGDQIIIEIGKIIKNNTRTYDCAGRYGGDEFIIILPNTNIEDAKNVAKKLRKKITKCEIKYFNINITFKSSFGISNLKTSGSYIAKLIGIDNIKSVFVVDNPKIINWNKINNYKSIIANQLLKIADLALYKAKQSQCNQCGFLSQKTNDFKNKKCPKCGSTDIIIGKNKIVFDVYD